ncbi:hypothetical protein FRC14_004450 [Serendipita sp. 396]|nr:hypothetical protein FRC14_004450 [Serendipita sp. 396]KAG8772582.1 hypothetical protein FRC15_002631 [Serendipita sp. 397]KAG8825592.1 hypothetical protein FRC19_010999 [Serendipita sp. 401]KAG8846322.1 hypothetical protein FRB91_000915 [Serendipita sp. 411]KAG8866663.1 hypothetical protein FRC20_007868 [Serendipita sp. 405]KAG9052289.1 hypothetical protein FS842_010181 [Serendipita sp. 407]
MIFIDLISTETLEIHDPSGVAHTYKITPKTTGGKTQSIYTVENQPLRLVKGPVSWLEAMVTEAYEPGTVIGTKSTGAAAAGSSTGTGTREGNSREAFNTALTSIAQTVQDPKWNPSSTKKVYLPLSGKKWWMDMPVVGRPIRELGPIKDALRDGPNKAALVTTCKTYMANNIVPAVNAALDEWHTEVHAKLNQWFVFTDIKVPHFRWIHDEDQPPKAKMIDFGSATVSSHNEKPTETAPLSLWQSVCDGLNLSNTPSEKAPSDKAPSVKAHGDKAPSDKAHSDKPPSQKSGTAGHGPAGEIPTTSAAGQHGHSVPPVTDTPATNHPGMQEPPPSEPMAIPHTHSTTTPGGGSGGGSNEGSTGSSPKCSNCWGLCSC